MKRRERKLTDVVCPDCQGSGLSKDKAEQLAGSRLTFDGPRALQCRTCEGLGTVPGYGVPPGGAGHDGGA